MRHSSKAQYERRRVSLQSPDTKSTRAGLLLQTTYRASFVARKDRYSIILPGEVYPPGDPLQKTKRTSMYAENISWGRYIVQARPLCTKLSHANNVPTDLYRTSPTQTWSQVDVLLRTAVLNYRLRTKYFLPTTGWGDLLRNTPSMEINLLAEEAKGLPATKTPLPTRTTSFFP